MKISLRSAAALGSSLLVTAAVAQTNTFPGSGNVGIGTTSPAAKLDVSYGHGEYSRQVLKAAANGSGTGEAGLYTWVSEPWWSWTGAGIGRNIYNSGTWGARVNPNLSAQMMQFREDPSIAFSIWDSSGNGYTPLTLKFGNALFSGNVGIGTTAPAERLSVVGDTGVRISRQSNTDQFMMLLGGDGGGMAELWTTYNLKIRAAGSGAYGNVIFCTGASTEAMRIASSGNVGIGITAPSASLDVNGKGLIRNGLWVAGNPAVDSLNGSPWYGIGATSSAMLGPAQAVQVAGWGGLNFQTGAGQMVIRGDTGNVGIGTTNPTNKFEVNGTIRTKEVIVEATGWSDYVFAPDYRLAPLSEVEAHIQAKGTLPGIPSAAEVAEHGVSVGDMQAKLLAKLEEVTLHMIALSKKVDAQSAQLSAQATEIATLKAENAALRQP